MMIIRILIASVLFVSSMTVLLGQDYTWIMGNNLRFQFFSPSDVRVSAYGLIPRMTESVSLVHDPETNEILFYTDGTTVWDRNQQVALNGTELGGNFSTSQSVAIIQSYNNPNQYYIFSLENVGSVNGNLFYSIVNEENGIISVTTKKILITSELTEKMIAIKGNCDYHWLVVHERESNNFLSIKVSKKGIETPIISETGSFVTKSPNDPTIESNYSGKIRASHNKNYITSTPTNGPLELFNFDAVTGIISNSRVLQSRLFTPFLMSAYSSVFSLDNRFLFTIESQFSGHSEIIRYDLSLNDITEIRNSKLVVYRSNILRGIPLSDLQIDPYGRILVSGLDLYSVSLIEDPSNIMGLVMFRENVFPTSPIETRFLGFHEYPLYNRNESNPRLFTIDTLIECNNTINSISISDTFQNYQWSTGSDSFLTGIDKDGKYIVSVITNSGCSICDSIVVKFEELEKTLVDTLICFGDDFIFNDRNVTTAGIYIDTLISVQGCDSIVELNLKYYEEHPLDTVFINIEQGRSVVYNNVTYNTSGLFDIVLKDSNGCDSIVILNLLQKPIIEEKIVLANVFSPNGDGVHDKWFVSMPKDLKPLELRIYNRWGNEVYQNRSNILHWDGFLSNGMTSSGVYVYVIIYENNQGIQNRLTGDVLVIQ